MCTVIQIDSGEIANFSQKMSHKLPKLFMQKYDPKSGIFYCL